MSLIQITVDDDVRARADAAFARNGITTPMAMKMMVTQVANEGRTPFDGVFTGRAAAELAENVRRDMVYAEAQELGLIPDDAGDALHIPDDVLAALGISPDEVGQ
ncbi:MULTISPECIES: type II toxin-antitoxin system RelB/DinJ family antitoxin [unclassified Adlercreutzia]|uniref:type II toxin-antitoxin system RelB/DinJ family antitoxin n=1 Tax=unclassified Adlercreutzia TaxID=2636013 RepID=UPI0013EA5DB2|nr:MULTISPECIES: type II toxin-antitoxin system RelB/DinJ family antitoxin [unclassified Adlercreutzia]